MKKIAIIILTLFLNLTFCYAQVNTLERTEDDLGVNKNVKITEENKDNILNTPRVDAQEKVYDFAQILDEEVEKELYQDIISYIDKSTMDMVILTINLPYSDLEIENYAADFYDYNDFGLYFENYSGILIVRNINEYNRFFNIYTFGNAQLYYPYERCEEILDNIYYELKNDQYLEGFKEFISDSESFYQEGIPDTKDNYYIDENGFLVQKRSIPFLFLAILSLIISIIVLTILVKKNKLVKIATEANAYLDNNSVAYNHSNDIFLTSHTSSYIVQHHSSSSGGSRSSSRSGSSGRGHGGGGGRHG